MHTEDIIRNLVKEVYSEKQRRWACVQANLPADERAKGLSKKEAEEMCSDTSISKKLSEAHCNKIRQAIREVLTEKKKRDRCLRIADRKFDKPSAYKSGAVVRCRKGDIWKDLKEDESLRKWFNRQGAPGKKGGWVDCNTCRKDSKTGRLKCKACGREKGEKRAKYPSCRPTPSQCKDKGKGKKWGKTK